MTESTIRWNTCLLAAEGLLRAGSEDHKQGLTVLCGTDEFAIRYFVPQSTLELMTTYFATEKPSISRATLFGEDAIREAFSNLESRGDVQVKDEKIPEEKFGKRSGTGRNYKPTD